MDCEKHDEYSINIPLYCCNQKMIQGNLIQDKLIQDKLVYDNSINQLYNAIKELNKRLENYKYDYYILLMLISLLIILFMICIISNIYY